MTTNSKLRLWLWIILGIAVLWTVSFVMLSFTMGITLRDRDIGDKFKLSTPCSDAVHILSDGISSSTLGNNFPSDYQTKVNEEYTYTNPYRGISRLRLEDGYWWVRYYAFPASYTATSIVLNKVSKNESFNEWYFMDSSKLGFMKSREIRIAFEEQILAHSGIEWKNTTFFLIKLGPAYMWTFSILGDIPSNIF